MQRMETTRHDLYYFHADLIVLQLLSLFVFIPGSLFLLWESIYLPYCAPIARLPHGQSAGVHYWRGLCLSFFLMHTQYTQQMTQLQFTTNHQQTETDGGGRNEGRCIADIKYRRMARRRIPETRFTARNGQRIRPWNQHNPLRATTRQPTDMQRDRQPELAGPE